jgi:hypothetical protein
MRRLPAISIAAATLPMLAARPSEAQYAAQLYPYCSLSLDHRCDQLLYQLARAMGRSGCISNPRYIGPKRARSYLEGQKPLEPHYVQP